MRWPLLASDDVDRLVVDGCQKASGFSNDVDMCDGMIYVVVTCKQIHINQFLIIIDKIACITVLKI